MSHKMVSVIIPSYGQPVYLENAINSILSQTYSDWELIIVDDNNPDTLSRAETERLVNGYDDKRIKYIKHPYNKNGAAARNTALKVARGEFVSFLDSDDEYFPNRLEECIKVLSSKSDNIAGVYTGCEFRRGGRTYLKYVDVKDGNFLVDTLACRFMFCTGSNIFIRKSVAEEVNGFDEAFLRHQDYEFLVRIFERYDWVAIPQVLVVKNNENLNLPDIEKMESIKQQYIDKFTSIIDSLSQQDRNYIFHSNYISIAEQCMRQGYIKRANEIYRHASRYGSLTNKEWFRRISLPVVSYLRRQCYGRTL